MKENKFFDIMDARIRDACAEQVMAVANLARRCLNSKGKKRPYMKEVFTELERISSSPENALVQIENEDGYDEEEEGMNMIEIADSWTVGVTAPAFSTVASASSADVEPLFPQNEAKQKDPNDLIYIKRPTCSFQMATKYLTRKRDNFRRACN
ncbi:hypothetical protein YC2023_101178 [Brassica napus]